MQLRPTHCKRGVDTDNGKYSRVPPGLQNVPDKILGAGNTTFDTKPKFLCVAVTSRAYLQTFKAYHVSSSLPHLSNNPLPRRQCSSVRGCSVYELLHRGPCVGQSISLCYRPTRLVYLRCQNDGRDTAKPENMKKHVYSIVAI